MKIKEMEKSEIVDSLEFALVQVLCENLEGVDEVIMKNNIKSFIRNIVESYEPKEILAKFHSPEESIRHFLSYLEDYIENDESTNKTLH